MGRLFEQIDSQPTELGEITLRRRRIPGLTDEDIYEVKLGDEFLMSSLFVAAEEALGELGVAAVAGDDLQVVVGGLGLGHTARAALVSERVGELWVVELLEPVIGWHRDEKVPLGRELNADPRCHFELGSFFERAKAESTGFVASHPGKKYDAVLLDIDHSPDDFLDDVSARFYSEGGLSDMARQLRSGGIFGLWSNDPPDETFMTLLRRVFDRVDAHVITFYNPFQNNEAAGTVYIAVK